MIISPFRILFLSVFLIVNSINAQTNWTKYGNGPVLSRDTNLMNLPHDIYAISDPFVLINNNRYKMWYTCGGLNYPSDTLLRARICYSESFDGINWNKDNSNPVLDVSYNGNWDSLGVETPYILIDSFAPLSQRYKMWYAGQYFNSYRYEIGYAYSADGIHWTKHPQPVLKVGDSLAWDGGFIEGPSVLIEQGVYKMWYSGYNLTNGKVNTGYATSSDGIQWRKYASNPVISVSSRGKWDSYSVQDPHVLKVDSIYHMWYGGLSQDSIYGQEVGYAFSTDGIKWRKSPQNPVLNKGTPNSWDANTSSFPSVLLDNNVWKMWYTGKDVDPLPTNSYNYYWEIGYAIESTAEIKQLMNQQNNILIYPNPAKRSINIQYKQVINKGTYSLYDAMGRKVDKGTITNKKLMTIDLKYLKRGLYILVLDDGILKNSHRFLIE